MTDAFDLLIVGGGVNGTAIARAAALAGQSVLLVEQGDLAQATSSASTKLMHGGLRYLEHYEFKLVGESLKERGIMLRMAPHIVQPLEFRLPHAPSMRPWPIVRIGLWLYDLLALGGGLPRSRSIRIDDPGIKGGGRGFSYWDGQVDDARLVVLNALDAQACGAEIATRTRFVSASAADGIWQVELEDGRAVRAKTIVNAAGPWVDRVLREGAATTPRGHVRLVRGSHVVVPRCLGGDHAWLLQQPDGRIVFAIPWFDFTLIGTTDFPVDAPEDAAISEAETDYILAAANLYLTQPLTRADVVHSFAGIRPLFDDGSSAASAVTRDYRLELDTARAPILSVFGGKITTARHLAEVVLERLGIAGGDTETRPLPGGDFADFAGLFAQTRRNWPFLDAFTAARMTRAYGTRLGMVLGDARSAVELGRDFGSGLTAREVAYLIAHEWAVTAEDILWRRTKLGLRFSPEQVADLRAHLGER